MATFLKYLNESLYEVRNLLKNCVVLSSVQTCIPAYVQRAQVLISYLGYFAGLPEKLFFFFLNDESEEFSQTSAFTLYSFLTHPYSANCLIFVSL